MFGRLLILECPRRSEVRRNKLHLLEAGRPSRRTSAAKTTRTCRFHVPSGRHQVITMPAHSRCPPISLSARSQCPPDLRALTASARSRSPPAHGLRLRPLTASVHSRPPRSARSQSPLTVSAKSPLAHGLRLLTISAPSPPLPAHHLHSLTASARSRPPLAHDL